MDMSASLDQRHPSGRALRLEKGLRRSDPGGKGSVFCGVKLPPLCDMTTGSEGETRAVADQDDLGVAFDDGAGGCITESAGSVTRPL